MSNLHQARRVVFVIVSFIIVVGMLILASLMGSETQTEKMTIMDSGWEVSCNGKFYASVQPQTMASSDVPIMKKGDVITLTTTLPQNIRTYYPAIYIKTRASMINVYIDGTQVYSHDEEYYESLGYLASGGHIIDLPYNPVGENITIQITAAERFAFLGIESPIYGEYESVRSYLIRKSLVPLIIALFIIIYGIVFLIITMVFSMQRRSMRKQIFSSVISSLLCMDIGIWLLCHFDLLHLMLGGGHTVKLWHMSLILMIPIVYAYTSRMRESYNDTFSSTMRFIVVAIAIILLVIVNSQSISYTILKIPFLIIGAIMTGQVFALSAQKFSSSVPDASEVVQLIGIDVMVVVVWISGLGFVFLEYMGRNADTLQHSIIPIGALFLVFSQMFNYFVYTTQTYIHRQRNEDLHHRAYNDALTGLANKKAKEDVFEKLEKSSKDFCIIVFDLNGLKLVNDTVGHVYGDHLIITFATVLKMVFENYGFISRIGGDEFVVALEETNDEILGRLLSEMEEKLAVLDKREWRVNHSTAYGYCYRHEISSGTISDVFKCADSRMYEMKKIQKAAMRAAIEKGSSPGAATAGV